MLTLPHSNARGHNGQSLIEYALILALVAMIVLGALALLGVSVSDVYCTVIEAFGAQCTQQQMLAENFDGGLGAWNFTAGGTWDQQNGQLCASGGGEHRAFTGDEGWTDYVVHVDNTVLSSGNGYGTYFRVQNEPAINGYVFQYDPGYRGGAYPNGAFLFREITNGSESGPLSAVAAPPGYNWAQARDVEVQVNGNTFTAVIDGQPVLTAQDSTYRSGRVGLRSWDSSIVCFDGLSVTDR